MNLYLEPHWIILAVGGLALAWAGSLAAMRYATRRQVLRALLAAESDQEIGLPPESRPEDQDAQDLIRSYRNRYLWSWWPETELSFKAINEMGLELVKKIAAIYYPREERPELKASLADLINFHNRVGERLAAWLETAPIRPFKNVELGTALRYYDKYRTLKGHAVMQFIERHRLTRVASWGWAAFNYNSPFYWGRRASYEAGRRLLMARLTDLVGEEAVLLYGRTLRR